MEVQKNQNIFNVCIQEFGTLENLFEVLEDNKIPIDKEMKAGEVLSINSDEKGIEPIKKQIKEDGLIFTNGEIE